MSNCVYHIEVGDADKRFAECINCGSSVRLDIGGSFAERLKKEFETQALVENSPKKFIPKKLYDPNYDYSCSSPPPGKKK